MKNRDRLRQISQYDILCRINSAMIAHQDVAFSVEPLETTVGYLCVLDAITMVKTNCPGTSIDTTGYKDACSTCIARWLNEEFDGRW